MKRSVPDPGAVATALMARLEQVETRLTAVEELRQDTAALGRGLADVVAQVRILSDHATRRIVAMPNQRQSGTGPDGTTSDEADDEQPNWLTVVDEAVAGQWLADAVAFADDVLAPLGHPLSPACWPLHPRAVVEAIALRAQHATSYSASVTEVSEFLSRWLPGAAARIAKELTSCENRRAHICRGRAWEIPHLAPDRVAAWWVDTRGTGIDEVEAFSLTRIP